MFLSSWHLKEVEKHQKNKSNAFFPNVFSSSWWPPSRTTTQECQQAIWSVNQKQFSYFPDMSLNGVALWPCCVEVCPQWPNHGQYCWAVLLPFSSMWGTQVRHKHQLRYPCGPEGHCCRWPQLKSNQGRGNSTRRSKYIKVYKLPSELFTNTQVLQAKSCSPVKICSEAERCFQPLHPAQFSSSEGLFLLSLLLWKVPEERAVWPGHLQEGRQRCRGGRNRLWQKGLLAHSTEVPAVKNTSKLKHSELFCSIFNWQVNFNQAISMANYCKRIDYSKAA